MPLRKPYAALSLALSLLAPRGAALAQVASQVEAGASLTTRDAVVPASVFTVTPGLSYSGEYGSVSARGAMWYADQQWQLADGALHGTLVSPTIYGVRAELLGNASRAFYDRELQNDQVDLQTRIHLLLKEKGGIWIGGGLARPWRVAVASSVDVRGGGAWTTLYGATVSGNFTNFYFTKVAQSTDTAESAQFCGASTAIAPANLARIASFSREAPRTDCHRQSQFSDLEASVHYAVKFLEITAQSGMRFGSAFDVGVSSRHWAAGTATAWLNDRVAAIAGGGRQPSNPARGLPARNYFSLGMMLAYWPIPKGTVPVEPITASVRSFDAHALKSGDVRITLRVGGVERVELMGDFTDWSALVMTRRGRDLWEITVPMNLGVHQINVRLDDGPWLPPPGMPTRKDGFNGEVGMLVVNP
ncbi:MAG: hypothetical protein JWO05_2713 [Gemmatimonadetes bacterium]|nr:hypothetical protein [Gemmatimonadota bacterium]